MCEATRPSFLFIQQLLFWTLVTTRDTSPMAGAARDQEIVLLLMGKTGYGKSSTGNSILGRKGALETSCNATACTVFVNDQQFTRYDDHVVRVIDSPGFCDTEMSKQKGFLMVCEKLSRALVLCSQGFDALLLVLRFGNRFTEEDKYVVTCLKKIFGSSLFNKFGILVFTHGEDLDMKNKGNPDNPLTFKAWLKRQEGGLKTLVEECKGRCVLFRNLDTEAGLNDSQQEELLAMVMLLKSRQGRYNSGVVGKWKEERDKVVTRMRHFWLRDDCQKRISLLRDSIHKLTRRPPSASKNPLELMQRLDRILEDAKSLKAEINESNAGTEEIDVFVRAINSIEHEVMHLKSRLEPAEFQKSTLNGSMSSIIGWIITKMQGVKNVHVYDKMLANVATIAVAAVDVNRD